jgi:hypothetical protein
MSDPDITHVASDNRVTRLERRGQSAYREKALRLPAGVARLGRTLGNYLSADDQRSNVLSDAAAEYAAARAEVVTAEGGQLEQVRLFTTMLSSEPLAFTVFGHLRAHPSAAVSVLSARTGRQLTGLATVADADSRRPSRAWRVRRCSHRISAPSDFPQDRGRRVTGRRGVMGRRGPRGSPRASGHWNGAPPPIPRLASFQMSSTPLDTGVVSSGGTKT